MILESVRITVRAGEEAGFEAAVGQARAIFSRAMGFEGLSLHRSVQHRLVYILMIRWATLEHHTVGFRGSALFAEWRALAGPFFALPPEVEHSAPVIAD
ncbi:MAG: antibiotic biosynthesis monooxygenase [Acidocella sp.]|nr:antibiotic biosynthesis monooxygenase [Acidocella sp.]